MTDHKTVTEPCPECSNELNPYHDEASDTPEAVTYWHCAVCGFVGTQFNYDYE